MLSIYENRAAKNKSIEKKGFPDWLAAIAPGLQNPETGSGSGWIHNPTLSELDSIYSERLRPFNHRIETRRIPCCKDTRQATQEFRWIWMRNNQIQTSTNLQCMSSNLEHEQFGTSIGIAFPQSQMSRWFLGKPNIVKTYKLWTAKWICPIEGCFGEMIFNGAIWPMSPPGYHHTCDKCGFTAALSGRKYPGINKGDDECPLENPKT